MKKIKVFLFVCLLFSVTGTLFASESNSKENKEHIGCEEIFTEIEAEFPAINPEKKLNILRTLLNGGIITIRERTCEYKKIGIDLEKIDFEAMDEKTLEILSNDSTIQRLILFRKLAESATEESDKRADIWSNENIFNLQETLAKYRETEDLANNSIILWLKRFEEQNNQDLEEYINFVKKFLVHLYNKLNNYGREIKKQDINQTMALWEKLSKKALKETQEKIRKNTEELDVEKKKLEEARLKLQQEHKEAITAKKQRLQKYKEAIAAEKLKLQQEHKKELKKERQRANQKLKTEKNNLHTSYRKEITAIREERIKIIETLKASNKRLTKENQAREEEAKENYWMRNIYKRSLEREKNKAERNTAKLQEANKIIAQYKNKIEETRNELAEHHNGIIKIRQEQKEILNRALVEQKNKLYAEFEEKIKRLKQEQKFKNKARRFFSRKSRT